ncbi:MAG: hypothetical protein RBS99_18075 [Rhodospirillales bacterium]|nr:hypothetical protein [Rhodospirillales bacterium]
MSRRSARASSTFRGALTARRSQAATRLVRAGAHFVIDGFADLPLVVEIIRHLLESALSP